MPVFHYYCCCCCCRCHHHYNYRSSCYLSGHKSTRRTRGRLSIWRNSNTTMNQIDHSKNVHQYQWSHDTFGIHEIANENVQSVDHQYHVPIDFDTAFHYPVRTLFWHQIFHDSHPATTTTPLLRHYLTLRLCWQWHLDAVNVVAVCEVHGVVFQCDILIVPSSIVDIW